MVTVTKFYCKCCDVYKISQKKLEEHYKTEKHKKKDEEAKRNESIPDYVLELRNDFSNKIDALYLENQEMKKRIQRLESVSKAAIINSYNEIETVELKPFGTEDTTHLNEKKILQMMSECTSFVKDIITQIHFNINYPENHNLVIPNKNIDGSSRFEVPIWILGMFRTGWYPATIATPTNTSIIPIPRVIYPACFSILASLMMVLVRIPIIAKTKTKPSERVNETFSPLRIPTSRLSSLSDSRPRKYDKYAGSIANPHGLKAAIKPAARGNAKSTLIMI